MIFADHIVHNILKVIMLECVQKLLRRRKRFREYGVNLQGSLVFKSKYSLAF